LVFAGLAYFFRKSSQLMSYKSLTKTRQGASYLKASTDHAATLVFEAFIFEALPFQRHLAGF
jgi:hypothetical protein